MSWFDDTREAGYEFDPIISLIVFAFCIAFICIEGIVFTKLRGY